MTAPTQRDGGIDANARGMAVLVVAVLIGLLLLWKAGDDGSGAEVRTGSKPRATVSTGSGETTTTTTRSGSSSTTSTTSSSAKPRQPGQVSVIVLNGSGKDFVAKSNSETIGRAGYKMGPPANANPNAKRDATAVFYAPGYQTEAIQVASVLGRPASVVEPLPKTLPGPGAEAANVVVVLGRDVSPVGGASSTTTTTSSASTSSTTAAN